MRWCRSRGRWTPTRLSGCGSALRRTFGGEVDVRIEVVPDVMGGIIVQIGDEVVDGSVAHRLAEAQRLLGR